MVQNPMKIKGEFVVRQVMDHVVAIPVGSTALQLNGMIMLNDVSKIIWDCLTAGSTVEAITQAVTQHFEVSEAEAKADALEFLDELRRLKLLDEESEQ